MGGTLQIGVLVATAIYLDDLILMLQGKGLQAVINNIDTETDESGLETDGKGNGGKLALINLTDSHFIQFTKLIMIVTDNVNGNFFWPKYWLSQFHISFCH